MKKICEITLSKPELVDKIEVTKDERGNEITTTKKVTIQKNYKYFIRKPNRSLNEGAELFYHKIYWECINQGIKPSVSLQKRYLNDGGVLSEDQKKEYQKLYENLFTAQAELKQFQEIKDKTEEQKKKEEELFNKVVDLYSSIQTVENNAGENLYQHTAENISRNRSTIWWMLNLSYKDNDGKFIEVFPGITYEEKLKSYDTIQENEDKFDIELIQKLLLATSLWFYGKAETQADFDIAFKLAENSNVLNLAENLDIKDKKEDKGFIPTETFESLTKEDKK